MQQEPTAERLDPTSFSAVLKELTDGKRPPFIGKNQVSPIETIRELTAAYYLFGIGFVFKDTNIISLVEHAICPLARDSSNFLVASFSEPYTAWCCYNFFKWVSLLDHLLIVGIRQNSMPIEEKIFHELGQFHFLPSVRGLVVKDLPATDFFQLNSPLPQLSFLSTFNFCRVLYETQWKLAEIT